MAALRRTVSAIAVATAMLVSPSGKVLGQSGQGTGQPSTAELARNIANAIATFAPKSAQGSFLKFESAVANGNVVEIRYSVADPAAFARMKANSAMLISGKTGYFCNEARVAPIRQGVIIHDVTAVVDGSDRIEITVDRKTCDRQLRPALADPKTLAQMAGSIAKAENASEPSSGNGVLRFEKTTSHDAVVEKRVTVLDAPAFRAGRTNISGVITGYSCGKYREQILQGVVIRYDFTVKDGSPEDSLVIDRSKC
jgi:hypothetical protein